MGFASAVISLLAALFGAFPSIKELVHSALELADKVNSAEATLRKANKDKAVDDATFAIRISAIRLLAHGDREVYRHGSRLCHRSLTHLLFLFPLSASG